LRVAHLTVTEKKLQIFLMMFRTSPQNLFFFTFPSMFPLQNSAPSV
jgi:hypothetical protein